MNDPFAILTKWDKPLPPEKLGNSGEDFIQQIDRDAPGKKKRRKKQRNSGSAPDPEGENREGARSVEEESTSGKILDITI